MNLENIISNFKLESKYVSGRLINTGHINDTYLIDTLMDIKEHKRNDTREEFFMVQEMLKKLKPALAQIIDMIYFQDIPQAEVANLLGISQMQVSRRLKKATSALQELLSGTGIPYNISLPISNPSLQPSPEQQKAQPSNPDKRISRSSLGAKLQAQRNLNI